MFYERSFSGAKIKYVKDVNPCIREKNPDHVEWVQFWITKNSKIDVAKGTQSDSREVIIPGIYSRITALTAKPWISTRNFSKCVTRKNCFSKSYTSTRKLIWIKTVFTSTVVVMKCLVRILELRNISVSSIFSNLNEKSETDIFCEFFKNAIFKEHLRTAASIIRRNDC